MQLSKRFASISLAPTLILAAVFNSSCATIQETDHSAFCEGSSRCDIPNAMSASIETLREHAKVLSVSCDQKLGVKMNDSFRAACRRRFENLSDALSSKWRTQMNPIDKSSIVYKDNRGWIDFVAPGGGTFQEGLVAELPLSWRRK